MPTLPDLRILAADPASHATPLLAVALASDQLPAALAALDGTTGGALARALAAGDFTAKRDETVLLYPTGPATRLLLVGVGRLDGDARGALRRAAAVAAKRARVLGVSEAAFVLPAEARGGLSAREAGQVVAEGMLQGAWYYGDLKRPPEEPRPALGRIDLLVDGAETAEYTAGHAVGEAIGQGHVFARNLQMLPGNTCTPSYLAQTAQELAARHGFAITVLDRAGILAEGMGGLAAVGQGSAQEPRFIALEYKGAPGAPVVLVGKGVTFDTGGISIKPAPNMEDMKYDMSGAAAVLGTFEMLGRLKPKLHVVGLVPSAENMPSSTAYKPGDVIRTHLGKTVEIVNTDAEGRMILCDALSWARRYEPAACVDIATLTGAMVIALGHVATGLMGTDEALIEQLRAAGERSGDRVWPLPLLDEYREQIKSDIADMKNTGGRPAGSLTAGWFLREFVDGFPWAHLDIAGTAYTEREDASRVRGPTAVGVRLFAEFLLARA